MNRPITTLMDQRIDLRRGPTVFHCHIIAIEFGAHSFVVNGPSYSGPRQVTADNSIDFGSKANPKVARGNDCLVQKDPQTGKYVAIQYIINPNCAPTTPDVQPFVLPPTTYLPPSIITFPPIGQITPPSAQLNNAYDIGDGLLDTVAAATTQEMLYFTTVRAWSIIALTAYCLVNLAALNVWAGRTYVELSAYRNAFGKWTVERYNGSTGALISTWTATLASDSLSRALAGADVVSVIGGGAIFRTQIVTGPTGISGYAYGLQGAMS